MIIIRLTPPNNYHMLKTKHNINSTILSTTSLSRMAIEKKFDDTIDLVVHHSHYSFNFKKTKNIRKLKELKKIIYHNH